MVKKSFTAREIAEATGMAYELSGDPEKTVSGVQLPDLATLDHLIWIKPGNQKAADIVASCSAGIIILDEKTQVPDAISATLIRVSQPRLAFIRALTACFAIRPKPGIHPLAAIDPDAKIGKDVHIGPFAVIGKCIIGDGSVIHGHVFLYDGIEIGENVVVNAGTVIGTDGYGYQRNADGVLEKFPHVGKVVIENDVEIGANACIDRGTIGETRICEGAKIDNLVHIAHNVRIGKHAAVIAQSGISGSVQVGDQAWIAPSSVVINGVSVGAKATVGIGAVVNANVPDGETWAGIPARPLRELGQMLRKLRS
jgi:UDP-3-O-[3-hydroxymyristoyl] glucosamine N-acyltransferase